MRFSIRRFLLCSAFIPSLVAQEPELTESSPPAADLAAAQEEKERKEAVTNFIRIHENDEALHLQTAITSYQKDEQQVDLIGAIHIADASYYEQLNREFQNYPAVLFEMIGGENLQAHLARQDLAPPPDEDAPRPKSDKSALAFLGTAYTKIADYLQLADQRDGIDYRAGNLIHADLTLAEFQNLQKEKKETLAGTLLKGSLKSSLKPQPKPPGTFQILLGILTKNPDRIKKELLPSLAHGDENSTEVFGDSIIIADRNARCLEVLDRTLKDPIRKIGIFYGAAHFPDLEKSLLARGFTKKQHRWVNAWTVAKNQAALELAE